MKLTTDRHEASRGLFATAELLVLLNGGVCRVDPGQFDSARSYGSGKDGADLREAMYGVGNLQSSPAMKTFYNKALLSTAGSDISQDFALVRDASEPPSSRVT